MILLNTDITGESDYDDGNHHAVAPCQCQPL